MSQRPAYNLIQNINVSDISAEKSEGFKQDFDQLNDSLIGGIGAIGELLTSTTSGEEPISNKTVFSIGYMLTNLADLIQSCREQSDN